MGLFGSIVGGALGAAGTIFGGMKASDAMRNVKRDMDEQRKRNDAWYERRYNEDSTQRADAQRVLSMTEDSIRARNRAAAGSRAVMGGTQESVQAAKAANNEALADAASRVAAAGDARRDAIEQSYRERDAQIHGQLNGLEAQKAANIAQAAKGVGQVGAEIAGSWDDDKTASDHE